MRLKEESVIDSGFSGRCHGFGRQSRLPFSIQDPTGIGKDARGKSTVRIGEKNTGQNDP
jgi:hypothetical protein